MKKVPLHSLILLIGPVGHTKGQLARSKFESYEIVSNDAIRIGLAGDKFRHDLNKLVEDEIARIAKLKLSIGERVVIDSSNLTLRERAKYLAIGDELGVPVFYIVLDRGKHTSEYAKKNDQFFAENEAAILRGDGRASVIDHRKEDFEVVRKFSHHDIQGQIKDRGYQGMTVCGDVHGNLESLKNCVDWSHARKLLMVQLGDIVDYGPKSVECVELMYDRVTRGQAIMCIGNHENKLERWLKYQQHIRLHPEDSSRKGPMLSEANKATTNQIEEMTPSARTKFECKFFALLNLARHHWVIGDFMFVHGASDPSMWRMTGSRLSSTLESMAIYGEIDKQAKMETRYPPRLYNWVDRIPVYKTVIVGHDILDTTKPKTMKGSRGGKAIFMDTGSSKGGHLSTADLVFKGNTIYVQNYNWL